MSFNRESYSSSNGDNSSNSYGRNSLALVEHDVSASQLSVHAPIVSSYNKRIGPLLDCVDKLRHLKIMQEGIQLPTIVVVGDQSSGKSSVLESLAGISLPRGQGICTRVPLIMRLQTHDSPDAEFYLEYNGKVLSIGEEDSIPYSINLATEEIAGTGRGISNTPLTLIVKKKGVPTLTMVDLPGITRVPVQGQPDDIYEQISATIMEYITPEESIVLNVLSATIDFSTCESIRMSQKVDKTGERTLAVVTKADKGPEGLLEKVTSDDVNIGLGYICVRNRIGNESYEEARKEEAKLFESHPLLSKISKSMVGIPVLAKRLVEIQASIISKCLPDIIKTINDKLSANMTELNKLPESLSSVAEAITAFLRIIGNAKDSLRKILLRGEFDEFPEDKQMHCSARLAEMLNRFSDELQAKRAEDETESNFLVEEIKVLEETKGIGLPNFLPRSAFLTSLQRKVRGISFAPVDFVENNWSYIEKVVLQILMIHSESYPQLQGSIKRAAQNLIDKKKEQSIKWVNEIIEMEKLTDYTCNPEYVETWNGLMTEQTELMKYLNHSSKPNTVELKEFGKIEIGHLRNNLETVQQAFDMKMRMIAYWKIVLRRLVDGMALHLLYSVNNLVNKEMEADIIGELMSPYGGAIERMLDESPAVADKRNRLKRSIQVLRDSKDVVSKIMDRIVTTHD